MKLSLILAAVFLLVSTACGHESVKTVRHAHTASASSGNSFASSFSGSSGGHGLAANLPVGDFGNNPAFWWAKADSPFKQAYEYFQRCTLKGNCGNLPGPFDYAGFHGAIPNNLPDNGCTSSGCSFSGSFNLNDKSHASKGGVAADLGSIDISKNPFLNGEYNGVAFSSCSGSACPGGKPHSTVVTTNCKGSDCKTNTQHGTAGSIDLSGNPFFSGGFAGVGVSGSGGGAGCSGAGGCGGSPGGVPQVQPPHVIGGCAGTLGGCAGSSSSSGSFGGSYSGFGVSGGSAIPVINTGSSGAAGSGCSGGSGAGCTGQGTFVSTGHLGSSGTQPGSGCSGVKGGCGGQGGSHIGTGGYGSSGQFGAGSSSTSFGGSSTIHGGSTSVEHGTTGGDSKGIFSGTTVSGGSQFGIPTTHPGQSGQPGQPGLFGISTSQPGQGQPGQPGQSGQPGQFGIPSSHPGQGQPGQPGQSGQPGQFGIPSSHPEQGQPGQPGQSGQPGQFGIPSSHPGQGQSGQPGQPGGSGQPGQPGHPGQSGQSGIPTTHPGQQGQTGFSSGSHSTSGSFGSTSFQQGISTSQPGKPGYTSGSQQGQPGYPAQPGQSGIPTTHPGQQGQTGFSSGSHSTSGSFGSTSFQQGISTSQPDKPGYTSGSQPIPTAQPGHGGFTAGSQTTTGSFGSGSGSFGSTSGTFGTTGSQQGGIKPISTVHPGQSGFTSGTQQHGQSTSGSFGGSSTGIFGDSTTKQVGQSGQPDYTSGSTKGQTTSGTSGGSTAGTFGTSGSFGTGQTGLTGDSQHGYTSGTQHGQTTTGTNTGGQTGYTSGTHGQSGYTSGTHGQTGYTSGGQTSFTSSPQGGKPTYTSGPQGGQPTYTSGPQGGQPTYTSGPQGGQPTYTSGPQTGYTSGAHSQTGFTSGTQHGGQTSFTSSPQGGQNPYTSSPQGGQPSYTSAPKHGQPGYTSGTQQQHGQTGGSFSTSGSHAGSGTAFTSSPHGKHTPSDGSGIGGKLDIKCSGQGLICVKKHLCNNGIVNKNGEGLFQVRDGTQYCDVNTEVCCLLPGHSGEPHRDIPLNIDGLPTGTYYSTQNSHQSSASSSASSSSSSNSNTFFSSHGPGPTNPTNFGPKYSPGSGPDSSPAGTYQPGQSVPFGGKAGTSPGLIHILPDGSSKTQAPGLVHFGPGQTPKSTFGTSSAGQPGLTHIAPNLELSTPKSYSPGSDLIEVYPNGEGATGKPGSSHVTPSTNEVNYKNINDNFGSSTIQTPGYLPPGPSPSPSPSSYSPDLLPPNKPTASQSSTYYPSPNPTLPTSPGYLPPGAGTNTSPVYAPTTRKPTVTAGYLPPNQVVSETTGNNNYLPPPKQPSDSNIIKINLIPNVPSTPKGPVDRIPENTNPRETVIRLTTDFPQNTTPYPGCAAALKCVQGDFCGADGVISTTRVILTKEQEEFRVPVTDCQDPETGLIGKCCRDPNYKDPWPASVLGQYRPDLLGFDDGTYKQNNKPQPGVKGGRPQVPRPNQPFEPNQIGSPSNNPNSVISPGYPVNIPNNPFDNRQVNPGNPVDSRPPFQGDYSQKHPTSVSKISSETCGVRHTETKPAGSGPIDANFAEIPWQAMVLRDSNSSLLCGGAIIRPNVVLTAAHCVEGLLADDVLVKGGEWKLGIDEEPKPFQINKVATIVRHPGYKPDTKLNDVALLILNEKFRMDKNVDTLCLPTPGEDIAKTFQKAKCITTGWGKTTLQLNILNSVMHILGVGIVQGAQCQQQLQQYHSDSGYLYNTNCVCGAPVQPQADICDVDVGSALACDRGDGRYTLAGIYSWDTGCNPAAQIAGYTKVDTQWIETTLQRPLPELKVEEKGFYAQLQGQDCHCAPGK